MQNQKNKKKFAKIYDRYVDKIYRFVFLKVGSRETAEDITSQVFTKGWRKVRTGEGIENLPAYLYQIARAEIADYYRQAPKTQVVSTESLQVADTSAGIEEIQQLNVEINQVKAVLNQLNEDYQAILIWRYTDGYSHKEIAKILGKSEGAVRVMAHRALEELRRRVKNG